MPRKKQIPAEPAGEFDVPHASPVSDTDDDDAESEGLNATSDSAPVTGESPEQRKIMRAKRQAKAETEQLRRLSRQFPIIARLLLDNEQLKHQLANRK